jgi:hypothetical protein
MKKPLMWQPPRCLTGSAPRGANFGEITPRTAYLSEPSFRQRSRTTTEWMTRYFHGLLILHILFLTAGCSARVEVSEEQTSSVPQSTTAEKARTKVAVELLNRREAATNASRSPKERSCPERTRRGVEIDGDGNVVITVDGDIHVGKAPKPAKQKPETGWNTKIAWPTQLRGADSWTIGCYGAVWVLVLAAVVCMITTANRKEEGGPLLSILAMLVAAAVLLQLLPHTSSGIQFLPISPWSYSGWESFGISLIFWTAILFAGYVVVDRSPDSPQVFAILCLSAMSLNAILSWSEVKPGWEAALGTQTLLCPWVDAVFVLI